MNPIVKDIIENNCKISNSPINGPSYVLPDGRFMDLKGSGYRTHGAFDDFLREDETVKKLLNNYPWEDLSSFVPVKEGSIRINDGDNIKFELLIQLPPSKISIDQFYSLDDWLDHLRNKIRGYSILSIEDPNYKSISANLDEVDNNYILNKVKRYYNIGRLD